MNEWRKDKAKSDIYLPEIQRILGRYLISEPSMEEDQLRNTDLMVLGMSTCRIACRTRNHEYLKYKNDFTIRVSRPSGNLTELDKIIMGWGDYFFYGHKSEDKPGKFAAWGLGDLCVFRHWHYQYMKKHEGRRPGTLMKNGDGSSGFRAYRWSDLPSGFVIAQMGIIKPKSKRLIE